MIVAFLYGVSATIIVARIAFRLIDIHAARTAALLKIESDEHG